MINETNASKLLKGARGMNEMDIDSIADALRKRVKMEGMAEFFGEFSGRDLLPLSDHLL